MVYRSVYNDLVQAWYNSSSHAVVIVVAKEKGLEVMYTMLYVWNIWTSDEKYISIL